MKLNPSSAILFPSQLGSLGKLVGDNMPRQKNSQVVSGTDSTPNA
jgi:hypothetical protein